MDWELSKENVQPLRSGRDVKALNAALKLKAEAEASAKVKLERLEDERRSYEREIQMYEGDDPLAPWLRYIKWIKETYPSGGLESEMLPVLEKCTRAFQRFGRYQRDVRYLRVWIQYADACVDAKDIFTFLEKNDIGQDHALFYEAYATNLELRRNYARANEIYTRGIARHAKPVDRLANMFKAFQERMAKRIQRKMQDEADDLLPAPTNIENENRRTLAPIRPFAVPAPHPSARQQQQPQLRQKRKAMPTPTKGKLEVFVDEQFGGSSALAPGFGAASRDAGGPAPIWDKLPSQAEGSKENVQKAAQWSAVRIPQKKTKSGNVGKGLDVFVDEEFAHSDSHGSGRSDNEATIRQKLEGKILANKKRTEAEALKENPLRHFGTVDPAPPGHMGPVRALPAATAPKSSPKVPKAAQPVFAYDTEAIQGPDGQELSFEEIRARDWEMAEGPLDKALPQTSAPVMQTVAEKPRSLLSKFADIAETTTVKRSDPSERLATAYHRLNLESKSKQEGLQGALSGASSGIDGGFLEGLNAPTESPVSRHGGLVDPTINTKEALADIMSMFNRPLPVETGRKTSETSIQRTAARQSVRKGALLPQTPPDSPPGHDPTLQIFKDDVFLPGAKGPDFRDEESISRKTSAGSFDSDVENLAPPESSSRPIPARDIKSIVAQQSALRPLSSERIQQLDVQFSAGQLASDDLTEQLVDQTDPVLNRFELPDNPAELALREAGQEEGEDEFQVWSDDPSERASQSLAPTFEAFSSKPKIPREEPVAQSRQTEHQQRLETPVAGFSGRLESREESSRGQYGPAVDKENVQMGTEDWSTAFIPAKSLPRSPGSILRRGALPEEEAADDTEPVDHQSSTPRPLHLAPGVPVNPWEPSLVNSIQNPLTPPLERYQGFHNLVGESFEGMSALRLVKRSAKSGGAMLQLGKETYEVRQCVGNGAFATVYLAYRMDAGYTTDLLQDEEDEGMLALKVQRPACPWEFYIYRQLDVRIPAAERRLFGCAKRMFCYTGTSVLVSTYGEHGTLQDLVNAYLALGMKGMDTNTEAIAVYYTIELLRMLEVLHAAGIIHGDFKPDNLLLRNDCEQWEDWAPGCSGSWAEKGLSLIDFGRSIDLGRFPQGQTFSGDCMTEAFRCVEMVESRPWTFQVDTYGLCAVVHCLLFGTYMEVEKVTPPDSRPLYRQKAPLKRYWNVALWQRLFDTLLNVPSCDEQPQLASLREGFEEYLSTRSKSVKPLLIKQNIMMFDRKAEH